MVGELTPLIKAPDLSAFRDGFGGEIILPEDAGYDAARVVWNGMVDRRPAMVVRPTGVTDVASAVRFAREADLIIAVRSGGHSLPGLSTCDDGIVIDLSQMRGVTVDPEQRVARVNGGALLGELDDAAQAFGLACPVGVVSHTGVAGLTLGGGIGRLQRRFGLTIDSLRAVELVTADGRQVRASHDENAELFWGLRGAGSNFGIATAFEFDLHPVGPDVTRAMFIHPGERIHELAALYCEFMAGAPDDVSGSFGVGLALPTDDYPPEVAGRPIALVGFTHVGSADAAERDLAPFTSFGTPVGGSIGRQPYLALQRMFDDAMSWGHRVYSKGVYVDTLPDELIDVFVEMLASVPGDGSFSVGALGGAIGRVSDDAMAYSGRTASFMIDVECVWDDPALDDAHIGWARKAVSALDPFKTSGGYVNAQGDAGHEVARSIFGEVKYERLVGLKRAWDPDNVFRLNQNIRP